MFAQNDNSINSINATAGEKKSARGDEVGLHHKQDMVEKISRSNCFSEHNALNEGMKQHGAWWRILFQVCLCGRCVRRVHIR